MRRVVAPPIRLHLALEGRSLQTVKGMWRERGAAVSTLLEPNLLVQSCVKNVRDLFQALSRCGFTSVNPFTRRSSAVRLPHVTGSARCLALAGPLLDAVLSGRSARKTLWLFTSFRLHISHDLLVILR